MKPEYEKYHLIDRYLRGELSREETAAFEKQMADPEFSAEVALQKGVNEMISANAFHHLRQQMNEDLTRLKHYNFREIWIGGLILILISSISVVVLYTKKSLHLPAPLENIKIKKEIKIESDSIRKDQSNIIPIQQDKYKTKVIIPGEQVAIVKELIPSKTTNSKINETSITDTTLSSLFDSTHIYRENQEKLKLDDNHSKGKVKEDPCNNVSIQAKWLVEKSCKNKNNGSIMVDRNKIYGGEKPYTITLSKEGIEIPEVDYRNLNAGQYKLSIFDHSGCMGSWKINVDEKLCRRDAISISISYDEKWIFDEDDGEKYFISIYNEAGKLIYKSSYMTGHFEWPGANYPSAELQTGVFIYIIDYANGNKETGQITIIQ